MGQGLGFRAPRPEAICGDTAMVWRPSLKEIEAAARILHAGLHHH